MSEVALLAAGSGASDGLLNDFTPSWPADAPPDDVVAPLYRLVHKGLVLLSGHSAGTRLPFVLSCGEFDSARAALQPADAAVGKRRTAR